jgi:hypothetical protein
MQQAEFDDAKLLWKMFYAHECFKRCAVAAQHIHEERLEKEDPLFYPLVTSVYVLYGKPFKRARGVGQLGEEMIPSKYLDLHRTLLLHRDQVYAHTDADYGEVRVLCKPKEMQLFATDFHARFPLMPSVIELCRILQEKTDYHVSKLFKRYKRRVPQQVGEYAINISDQAGDFFTREEPLISD